MVLDQNSRLASKFDRDGWLVSNIDLRNVVDELVDLAEQLIVSGKRTDKEFAATLVFEIRKLLDQYPNPKFQVTQEEKSLPTPILIERRVGTSKRGYVYVIKATGTDRYKVGHCKNAKARFKTLQTSSPHRLELISIFEVQDCEKKEREIHRLLKNHRVTGEWFDISERKTLDKALERY